MVDSVRTIKLIVVRLDEATSRSDLAEQLLTVKEQVKQLTALGGRNKESITTAENLELIEIQLVFASGLFFSKNKAQT